MLWSHWVSTGLITKLKFTIITGKLIAFQRLLTAYSVYPPIWGWALFDPHGAANTAAAIEQYMCKSPQRLHFWTILLLHCYCLHLFICCIFYYRYKSCINARCHREAGLRMHPSSQARVLPRPVTCICTCVHICSKLQVHREHWIVSVQK